MARIGICGVNLLVNLMLLQQNVFAVDYYRMQSIDDEKKFPCNFNESTIRTYDATDLVLCMNELAKATLLRQSIDSLKMTDRAYEDSQQSYADYSTSPVDGTYPTNYFNNNMLSSMLTGALPSISSLTNLFNNFPRPGFNLLNALSSISRFDDLKCIPRILCEVASGSPPGGGIISSKQSSGFQDFGKNAIFRLLTAFDSSGSLPIFNFGRAALLGYTNQGRPSMCYNEYPRCPRTQEQLISYLNNHNGGFFQFFNGNHQGSYYKPQQSTHRPYDDNTDNGMEYRILNSYGKNPTLSSESYSKVEDDRINFEKQKSKSANVLSEKPREGVTTKFVFPKEDLQPNRIIKSDSELIANEKKIKPHRFFPQDNNYDHDTEESRVMRFYGRPYPDKRLEKRKSVIYVPEDASTIVILNNYRIRRKNNLPRRL